MVERSPAASQGSCPPGPACVLTVVDDEKRAAERGGQPLGYTGAARIPDPTLVTLNGIVGSAAATEVLQQPTAFATASSPNCGCIYDGVTGTIEAPSARGRQRVLRILRACAGANAVVNGR